MTDPGLVAKKLLRIESCLRELDLVDPSTIETDLVCERFVEHTLQLAIQAALDAASHIVADDRLGDAETNHAVFDLLARHGWLATEQVVAMHRMIGFRNILVHEYEAVDVRIVHDIADHHRGDLQAFVDAIRARLA